MTGFLAHAIPISYRFPLPIWLYLVAGGAAVLLSAPAAAFGLRDREPWHSRNLYPALRRLRLGPILLTLCAALFILCLGAGLAVPTDESHEFFENPATLLIWVDFWVLLGIVSAFLGNVWEFVSPLNAAARALDRTLARLDVSPFGYPERLGRWPAVVLLVWWSWAELIWVPAKHPPVLASMALGYFVATLFGAAAFGAEAWLGNVEVFTVVARTFSRFAPFGLEPGSPDGWLAEPPERRTVRARAYGTGLREGAGEPAASGIFVLALLATVVYDGFSQTAKFISLENWFFARSSWLGDHLTVFETLLMLAIVSLFALAYALVANLLEGRDAARRYAPTLIPIAAVYFAAHYLTYLLFAGQETLAVLVDPFGHSWNPWGLGEYGIRKGIAPAAAVWWVQILLIVWGHVSGVFAAHRLAPDRRRALVLQAPLVLLMVAYTVVGLWVLAQQLSGVD